MTKRQGKIADMYSLIVLFFLKFDGEINGFQPLVDQVLLFAAKEKAIRKLLDEQGYGSKGKTLTKAALRHLMITGILKLVKKGYAWALTTGDTDMLTCFGLVEEDFKLSQENLIVLVDKVLKDLTDNVLALTPYKVTLVTIGAIKTIEADYLAAKDLPKQKQALKKAVTTSLAKEIKVADKILVICDNLINSEYEDTHPAMVLEYNNDRAVVVGVNRHTIIRAHVYGDIDHTEVIAGASMSIASLDRTEVTDIDGMGEIIQFNGGDYTLLVKAKGFVDIEVPFSIMRGKHVEIDVVLKPNTISGNCAHLGKLGVENNVSIVDTNFNTMTDAFGNYSFEGVPVGSGVIEISGPGGNSDRKTYTMVMGHDLTINFDF